MLLKLIQNTELKHLTSLVSPAFFKVMPRRQLMAAGGALLKNYRDHQGFEHAVSQRTKHLQAQSMPIELRLDVGTNETTGEPSVYAERLVTLYFHQLWWGETALLDLRASSIVNGDDLLTWDPSPLWTTWDPEFIRSLRQIYWGYYADDPALFSGGLKALHLDGAESLFRQQFGENVEATVFELKQFINSFDAIFNFAKDRKIALHHGFVALGIYLATMYENLDRLGVAVNVRRCFDRATTAQPETSHSKKATQHV